jgi:hypothetical protein
MGCLVGLGGVDLGLMEKRISCVYFCVTDERNTVYQEMHAADCCLISFLARSI